MGWTTTLVQRQQDEVLSGELVLPAVPDQHLVVLDAGRGRIESRGARGWKRSDYSPGVCAMTARTSTTTSRFR